MLRISIAAFALLLAAGCTQAEDDILQGYAEGDYLLIGPRDGGVIERIAVAEGDWVRAGELLFTIESADAQARATDIMFFEPWIKPSLISRNPFFIAEPIPLFSRIALLISW